MPHKFPDSLWQVAVARPPLFMDMEGRDNSNLLEPAIDRSLFEVPLSAHAKQNMAMMRKRTLQTNMSGLVEAIDVLVEHDESACTWVASTYAIVTGVCIQ